jgi:hypothetical protein
MTKKSPIKKVSKQKKKPNSYATIKGISLDEYMKLPPAERAKIKRNKTQLKKLKDKIRSDGVTNAAPPDRRNRNAFLMELFHAPKQREIERIIGHKRINITSLYMATGGLPVNIAMRFMWINALAFPPSLNTPVTIGGSEVDKGELVKIKGEYKWKLLSKQKRKYASIEEFPFWGNLRSPSELFSPRDRPR